RGSRGAARRTAHRFRSRQRPHLLRRRSRTCHLQRRRRHGVGRSRSYRNGGVMPNITRRDRVYLSLRDDLMSGRISPDERLGEEKLAERYLVSRTPVREALARLVSDGLVERREHSWFPFRPRFDDLADLYELRTLLE